jgi:hypothetical protein
LPKADLIWIDPNPARIAETTIVLQNAAPDFLKESMPLILDIKKKIPKNKSSATSPASMPTPISQNPVSHRVIQNSEATAPIGRTDVLQQFVDSENNRPTGRSMDSGQLRK